MVLPPYFNTNTNIMSPKTHTVKIVQGNNGRLGGVITPITIPLPIAYVRLLKELLQDEKRRREINIDCPSYLKTLYDKEILFLKSKLDKYEAN